jgi:hypothetical protein
MVILICAIVQIAVALFWFNFLRTNPTRSQFLVLQLLTLLSVGYASIFTARAGKFRKTVITLDWIMAILWIIALVVALNELPEHRKAPFLVIAMCLGVIVPSLINGIAVVILPPPELPPTPR